MTPALGLDDPAPLDPYEARAKLLVAIWLLTQLSTARTADLHSPGGRSSPGRGTAATPRPLRRRAPVRPPRAC
jgi:hypothetical protein